MKLFRLLLLLLLLALAAGVWVSLAPFGPSQETFVEIPTGTGANGIATRLAQGGIIRSRLAFLAMRRVHGGVLHAGEYRFDHAVPLAEVYRRILRGDVYTRTLVIPEGFNLFDIAQAVQTAGLGSASDFLTAARQDTSLVSDLSPHAVTLEGYLFPDTYRFGRHTAPQAMLAAMIRRFRQAAAQLGLLGQPTLARTVTLASLVEREVAIPAERPLVAGVFENRLKTGMPLATDPTVVYAALLDNRWRGVIHRSDLDADSPWNTYRHAGLPPGPICSPGVAALRAAQKPAGTSYLYFVADNHGHSLFANDLAQHNRNVQALRQAEANQP